MSVYRIGPQEAPQGRSPCLITGILVSLVLVLIGAGGLFWLSRYGFTLAPTPTPTATPAAPPTATPDFRATNIAADRTTQVAYEAIVTRQTPVNVLMPFMPGGPLDTPTPHSVNLPLITGGTTITPVLSLTPPVAAQFTPTATEQIQVNMPLVEAGPKSPLDSLLATPTPTVAVIPETETATPTATPLPTDTPTSTWTPTPSPTIILVNSLQAVVRPTLTVVFVRGAPSNLVTPVGSLAAGTTIRIQRRDATGEWIYFCCANSVLGWMRQAYAPPTANPTVTNLPPSATPDDVRWLGIEPWPANVTQPPTATPIPPDDYPSFRHDGANTARVSTAFRGLLFEFWSLPAEAAQRFTTSVVVVRQNVVAASADRELYSFNRIGSNQEWRFSIGQPVTRPPMVQENIIYFADDSGRAFALRDNGSPVWQTPLAVPNGLGQAPPVTGFVGVGSRLFIIVSNNGNYRVLQLDRGNGAVLNNFDLGNTLPQSLALGNQLLYVAGARLWALDIENFEVVWTRELPGITAPPVYAANGVSALAELYVAGESGRVYALDANLGTDVRQYDGGDFVSGLALGDNTIYTFGNGFVRGYDRRNLVTPWRVPIAGDVRTLIVSAEQLILVTTGGSIQFVNTTGSSVAVAGSVPTTVSNVAAVSGSYLFIPGDDGRLYAFSQ